MKILITGAAGYIGSYLTYKLSQEGHNVIGIDNEFRGKFKYLREKLSNNTETILLNIDINNKATIKKLFSKHNDIDVVVHLAAIPGLDLCNKYPEKAIKTNIYGTYNLLETIKNHKNTTFLFASTAAVYGTPKQTPVTEEMNTNPENLYGITKKCGEELCKIYSKNWNIRTIILRFGNVCGVGVYTYWETVVPKFVKQALNNEPITVYGDGEQTRDFINIKDLTNAIKILIEKKESLDNHEIFNISSGKPTTINHIAKIVIEKANKLEGKTPKKIYLPPRPGEVIIKNFYLSNAKIKKQGFIPRYRLEETIDELIRYKLMITGRGGR